MEDMIQTDTKKLFLGLDIGTGKVAAVIADSAGFVLSAISLPHQAAVPQIAGRAEQDPEKIWAVMKNAILRLPHELRRNVVSVGVTGQMHGILFLDTKGSPASNLITWQDGRCLEEPEFLPTLNSKIKHGLRSGFGCATLAWMARHHQIPVNAVSSGTIHDWAVARLCGQARPVTDPTDGASWGCFDLSKSNWDRVALDAAEIPHGLMPEVCPCGSLGGNLSAESARQLELPYDIPVAVAIGDNQASLLATLRDPEHELALTLGTGGQVSAVLPQGALPPANSAKFEFRPYPGGRLAVVAAVLSGGSAWEWLADTAEAWLRDLGAPPCPKDDIYRRLNELGLSSETEFDVSPLFSGERFDPGLRGKISGLSSAGLKLGPLSRGLARGIFTNMRDMIPADVLAGRTRIVGSGNALRRNELLRAMVQEVFGMPICMPDSQEEAAVGAAILGSWLMKKS